MNYIFQGPRNTARTGASSNADDPGQRSIPNRFRVAFAVAALTGTAPIFGNAKLIKRRLYIPEVQTVDQGVYRDAVLEWPKDRSIAIQMGSSADRNPPAQDEPATFSHERGLLHLPNLEVTFGRRKLVLDAVLRSNPGSHPLAFRIVRAVASDRCNRNLKLAAQVVGLSGDASINDLAREGIFDPLGMVNTGYTEEDFDGFGFASKGYFRYVGEPVALPEYGYPTFAKGALRSSANDMGRLLAALANGGALAPISHPGVKKRPSSLT